MADNAEKLRVATLLLAGFLLVALFGAAEALAASASGATQSHSGGGVTVKVTYLHPEGKDGPRFQVALDTHSVNLDAYDLRALSVLRDEAGKSYQPAQVEDKGGGHHREVTLTFPSSASGAKRLELVIRDVAGVKERTFRWELQ